MKKAKTKAAVTTPNLLTFTEAATRSASIRLLYHQLEEAHHGVPWTKQEDVIGFMYDIGELGKLVMAGEGRWKIKGDTNQQLEDKLAECLWWLFCLSGRLDMDVSAIFRRKLAELESSLKTSVSKSKPKVTKKSKAATTADTSGKPQQPPTNTKQKSTKKPPQ